MLLAEAYEIFPWENDQCYGFFLESFLAQEVSSASTVIDISEKWFFPSLSTDFHPNAKEYKSTPGNNVWESLSQG